MKDLRTFRNIYFAGAGGIGMSALIRYFLAKGKQVAGYDRTPCELTRSLEAEGARLHYETDVEAIPEAFRDPDATLVVYTPAIPQDHAELAYFRNGGFTVCKRAQALGMITRDSLGLCVAGTHGKTTTSTMAAHLLHQSRVGCTAFLGGISQNYGTNLLLSAESPYTVIEADEFDRSFHWLSPYISVITATDPDHLDVYGTPEAYLEGFRHYTTLIRPGGALILHTGLALKPDVVPGVRTYTYGRHSGDFHAERIRVGGGKILFDFVAPDTRIPDVRLGVPIDINIENGIAAIALVRLCGVSDAEILEGMASFQGVRRRFDVFLDTPGLAIITDYAHHPAEIAQSLRSVRALYAGRRLTAVFQPHLYTRTRDFYASFADSLSSADEVILTDIYPAREDPIPGVSSRLIYDRLAPNVEKHLCPIGSLPDFLQSHPVDVLLLLGAGDIDNLAPVLAEKLQE